MQLIVIISDSLGDSAAVIAEAAEAQFELHDVAVERLPNASTLEQVAAFLESAQARHPEATTIVFFTFANPDLSIQTKKLLNEKDIAYVDVLGPAINAIASASGQMPLSQPGLIHKTSGEYYRRVEAMEFAVDHDDGRNAQDLTRADIVLIGSSRTSKTPLAVYLATQGYKVANVPLAPGTNPPGELFEVEKGRLYGLTSKPELLAGIRHRRLGNALDVAGAYANIEYVREDLEEARALMRKLGCIVVHTDNRAVEETAAEILRYYSRPHPAS
ncbi:MAG: kinase/pyrophosphorylase [Coriobacteriales bacterium]|jgi:regulator of PEP synthase PpsR (kinase-PPPase family)|nr:kinase/pyrophosphorylase [Coriobacteriales bacterium]